MRATHLISLAEAAFMAGATVQEINRVLADGVLAPALTEDWNAWAAAGSVDTDLSFSSLLKLYRTDVAERRMPARRIVEALDVVEHV